MKCKCFTKKENDLIDTMVTSEDDHDIMEKSDFIVISDDDDTSNEENDSIVTIDDDTNTKEKIESIVISDGEEATKEANIDVISLSFLEKDDSFLSPWSWNPNNAFNNDNASTKEKEYLSFHPESYFTYQINDHKIHNENAQENYKLYSRSCSTNLYPAPLILVITKAANRTKNASIIGKYGTFYRFVTFQDFVLFQFCGKEPQL
ncbi:hypothetical protein KIW84_021116 [Lathyrus oleraceus]|uniref:Uncharacterized protein n=1 Tax=Pisum sativum TaxID=3888 RepID=A0A9D4Y6X2_PEA|nr:hypothetical protein KIW84_021116 [Pisum sativum]